MNEKNTCCFFGHRKIVITEELVEFLYSTIENLIIEKNVKIFLFGSKSEFDNLCHNVVTELKEKNADIKRIYVRAEYPYIDDEYRQYLLQGYEDTYFPDKIIRAGKASYIERNYEMIEKSNYCIVYYDENYAPAKTKSGTKTAYEYAKRKGLCIVNVKK